MHGWFWRFLAIYLFWNISSSFSAKRTLKMVHHSSNSFGHRMKRDFSKEPKKPFIIPVSIQGQREWLPGGSQGVFASYDWSRSNKMPSDPRLSPNDLPDAVIDYPVDRFERGQLDYPEMYDSRAEPISINYNQEGPEDIWASYDQSYQKYLSNLQSGREDYRPQADSFAKFVVNRRNSKNPKKYFHKQAVRTHEKPSSPIIKSLLRSSNRPTANAEKIKESAEITRTTNKFSNEAAFIWPVFESKPPSVRIGSADININSPALHRFLRKYYYLQISAIKVIKDDERREKTFKVMHMEFDYVLTEVLKHREKEANDTAIARSNKFLRRMRTVLKRNERRGVEDVIIPFMNKNPAGECLSRVQTTLVSISATKQIRVNSGPLNIPNQALWSQYDCPLYFENAQMNVIPYDDDDGVDISPPKINSVGSFDVHVLLRGPHLYNGEELLGDNHLLYFYKCVNLKINSVSQKDERECYFVNFNSDFLQFFEPYLLKEKILRPTEAERAQESIKNESKPSELFQKKFNTPSTSRPSFKKVTQITNIIVRDYTDTNELNETLLVKARRVRKGMFEHDSRRRMTRQQEIMIHNEISKKFETMIADASSLSGYRAYGFLAFLTMSKQKLIALFILILILALMTFLSAFYMCKMGHEIKALRCRPCQPCHPVALSSSPTTSSEPCTSTSYLRDDSFKSCSRDRCL